MRRRGQARLERRDVDERLERRAGLALGLDRAVELAAEEVVAADHGLHIARLRLEGDDGALGMLARARLGRAALDGLQAVPEGLLGGELHGRVERRVDVETALEQEVGAVLGLERLLDVVEEVLARRPTALGRDQPEVGLREPLGLVVTDRAELGHAPEHHVAPPLGRGPVLERRVARRRTGQPGEQRGLAQVELGDRLAEVGPRGRLDAVRALAEVHLVQVHLEDAILRVPALELER